MAMKLRRKAIPKVVIGKRKIVTNKAKGREEAEKKKKKRRKQKVNKGKAK
jgi:hypothetical protein